MVPISRVLPPIWTEEEFLAQVNTLPRPITPETVDEYNRLRAMGRRRGYAWPYRVYVDPARRANPIAAGVQGYINDGQPPIEGIDTRPIEEIDYEIAVINALMTTRGLIERIGNWDYFARNGYLWRGYKTLQIDRAGYRDQAVRCAPLAEAEAILQLAREGRYLGPEEIHTEAPTETYTPAQRTQGAEYACLYTETNDLHEKLTGKKLYG